MRIIAISVFNINKEILVLKGAVELSNSASVVSQAKRAAKFLKDGLRPQLPNPIPEEDQNKIVSLESRDESQPKLFYYYKSMGDKICCVALSEKAYLPDVDDYLKQLCELVNTKQMQAIDKLTLRETPLAARPQPFTNEKLRAVQADARELNVTMKDNLDRALRRGGAIEDLVSQTENLRATPVSFKKVSSASTNKNWFARMFTCAAPVDEESHALLKSRKQREADEGLELVSRRRNSASPGNI